MGAMSPWVAEFFEILAVTAVGSSMAGVAQFLAETLVFNVLRALESRGVVKRFCPSALRQESFKLRNFLAASISHLPLFLLVASFRHTIASRADMSLPHPLSTWALSLALMCLHDAWFFLTHSALHAHKGLYRALHSAHHRVTTGLGRFATSDADPLEFLIDWAGFYLLALPLALLFLESWSPTALGLALIPCGLVNVLGHCGYAIPPWLGAVLSFGILLLPGAQNPATHFLHHLDPRVNRALYFTWWDRVAGTYLGEEGLEGMRLPQGKTHSD